jgi:oligoribonuclease NrnB/cAMP/cGMP phosphodiesterase (DHH superfamily)
MAIHFFTHNDLDAAGCRIVAKFLGQPIETTEYHDYTSIEEALPNFLSKKKYQSGDTLIIADICPSQRVCKLLDDQPKNLKLFLYDHHKTRDWVTSYPWAFFDSTVSATELFFNTNRKIIATVAGDRYLDLLEVFVKIVTAYDLWQLNSPLRPRAEDMNSIIKFVGKETFVEVFENNVNADLVDPWKTIIAHLNKRKNRFVTQVLKSQLPQAPYNRDGLGNKFKIIFTDDFISEVGHEALSYPDHEDMDYICLVSPMANTVSLRSRKDETDVSSIAKILGGGGHREASGFQMNFTDMVHNKISEALNRIDY